MLNCDQIDKKQNVDKSNLTNFQQISVKHCNKIPTDCYTVDDRHTRSLTHEIRLILF